MAQMTAVQVNGPGGAFEVVRRAPIDSRLAVRNRPRLRRHVQFSVVTESSQRVGAAVTVETTVRLHFFA